MKKILSTVLAMVLVLSFGMTALAADSPEVEDNQSASTATASDTVSTLDEDTIDKLEGASVTDANGNEVTATVTVTDFGSIIADEETEITVANILGDTEASEELTAAVEELVAVLNETDADTANEQLKTILASTDVEVADNAVVNVQYVMEVSVEDVDEEALANGIYVTVLIGADTATDYQVLHLTSQGIWEALETKIDDNGNLVALYTSFSPTMILTVGKLEGNEGNESNEGAESTTPELTATVEALIAELEALQAQYEELAGTNTALSTEIAGLKNQISSTEDKIASLQSIIATLNETIETLTGAVGTLSTSSTNSTGSDATTTGSTSSDATATGSTSSSTSPKTGEGSLIYAVGMLAFVSVMGAAAAKKRLASLG